MVRNGFTFENTTPDALKDYCEEIKEAAEAHKRDRDFERRHGDPHDPPDAEVVEDVRPKPRELAPLNRTPQLRAEASNAKALGDLDDLIAARLAMRARLEHLAPTVVQMSERAGDVARLVEVCQRVANVFAVAPNDEDELPL